MPQLDIVSFLPQLTWFIFAILTFYYVLAKHFLPEINKLLSAREAKTQDVGMSSHLKSNIDLSYYSNQAAYEFFWFVFLREKWNSENLKKIQNVAVMTTQKSNNKNFHKKSKHIQNSYYTWAQAWSNMFTGVLGAKNGTISIFNLLTEVNIWSFHDYRDGSKTLRDSVMPTLLQKPKSKKK